MVFLLLTLAVVYAAFIYLYNSYRTQLEEELGQRLVVIASSAAAALDGTPWDAIVLGDTAITNIVTTKLEEIRTVNEVADIFLFDSRDTTVFDLGRQYPVGELNLALVFDTEAVTTALAGIPTATRLYGPRDAYLKSAYAAVLDREGNVLGGVGVEASATFFEVLGKVRNTLFVAAAVTLLGMALLGVVFTRLFFAQEALESQLRRTETLATMGQMAAMLAHEIRNPLGIIRGAAERIGERFQIQDDELYRFIPDEVDRLERTLGAYLDFAKPKTGELHDVGEALTRTLELVKHELESKGIQIQADIEEGEFSLEGDPHLLQQVFLNLFLNARDAMNEGGELKVTLRDRGQRIEVVVADNGIGMTEEIRRRATEPFYTRKETGSGLGLAVVNRVMGELGGDLAIQSRPDHGTTVTLRFPRAGS